MFRRNARTLLLADKALHFLNGLIYSGIFKCKKNCHIAAVLRVLRIRAFENCAIASYCRLIVARVARYRMMKYFLALCSTIGQVPSSRLRRPIETARMSRSKLHIIQFCSRLTRTVDSYKTVATPIR